MPYRIILIVLLIKFILIMPIPKPKPKEKQKDFMLRCIPEMMKEAKKEQAIAICYKSFKDKK
tara:strand:- start:2369 stop:2554 length:186 start_codon:yes stop_codon:yes gene_type:complete